MYVTAVENGRISYWWVQLPVVSPLPVFPRAAEKLGEEVENYVVALLIKFQIELLGL